MLHNQISSLEATLERRENDNRDLENEKARLADQLSEEEGNLDTCAEHLDNQYSKKHSELSDTVENKRKAFQELKEELRQKSEY